MKRHKILFQVLILGVIVQSCISINLGSSNKDFVNLFEVADTLSLHNDNEKRLRIQDDMILKYLCPIRNECLRNITNDEKLIYTPISKIDKGSYWLISYDVTDGYENKTYIAIFTKKEYKIISTLLVKQHFGDYYIIDSNVNNKSNTIKIHYYIKDIEDENIKHTIEEIYNLDAAFHLISRYPQEIPIVIDIR